MDLDSFNKEIDDGFNPLEEKSDDPGQLVQGKDVIGAIPRWFTDSYQFAKGGFEQLPERGEYNPLSYQELNDMFRALRMVERGSPEEYRMWLYGPGDSGRNIEIFDGSGPYEAEAPQWYEAGYSAVAAYIAAKVGKKFTKEAFYFAHQLFHERKRMGDADPFLMEFDELMRYAEMLREQRIQLQLPVPQGERLPVPSGPSPIAPKTNAPEEPLALPAPEQPLQITQQPHTSQAPGYQVDPRVQQPGPRDETLQYVQREGAMYDMEFDANHELYPDMKRTREEQLVEQNYAESVNRPVNQQPVMYRPVLNLSTWDDSIVAVMPMHMSDSVVSKKALAPMVHVLDPLSGEYLGEASLFEFQLPGERYTQDEIPGIDFTEPGDIKYYPQGNDIQNVIVEKYWDLYKAMSRPALPDQQVVKDARARNEEELGRAGLTSAQGGDYTTGRNPGDIMEEELLLDDIEGDRKMRQQEKARGLNNFADYGLGTEFYPQPVFNHLFITKAHGRMWPSGVYKDPGPEASVLDSLEDSAFDKNDPSIEEDPNATGQRPKEDPNIMDEIRKAMRRRP